MIMRGGVLTYIDTRGCTTAALRCLPRCNALPQRNSAPPRRLCWRRRCSNTWARAVHAPHALPAQRRCLCCGDWRRWKFRWLPHTFSAAPYCRAASRAAPRCGYAAELLPSSPTATSLLPHLHPCISHACACECPCSVFCPAHPPPTHTFPTTYILPASYSTSTVARCPTLPYYTAARPAVFYKIA